MTVTCKYSKRIMIIPGKDIYSVKDWALRLLHHFFIADWGVPRRIISDRDAKFLSELWKAIFEELKVKLLYFTAYHPQTDGQSESINQRVEIAFRFFLHTIEKPELWPQIFLRIQAETNNARTSIGKTPNEICYGFSILRPLDLLSLKTLPDPVIARAEVKNALDFAQMNQKFYYDRSH